MEADHATDPAAWVDGVRLIEQKLYQFLEQKELAPIAAEHQPFDPNFHEAIGQAPGPAGQILAQVQKGYLLGDRVLRPARVIVGVGPDDEEGDEQRDDAASSEATEADSGSPEPE
jgi:molecular chaperone GrpE